MSFHSQKRYPTLKHQQQLLFLFVENVAECTASRSVKLGDFFNSLSEAVTLVSPPRCIGVDGSEDEEDDITWKSTTKYKHTAK